MADGGEGTVAALVDATAGRYVSRQVQGPLGGPVTATFGVLGDQDTAVIEMAAASGLPLVPPDVRDPLAANTYGTGELIRAALDLECSKLIVGIGGSATTDCGAGMAQGLGARMLAADGEEVGRATGGRLGDIASIDTSRLDERLGRVDVRVACDVDNPLYGSNGAAYVYGPQKGATPDMVAVLDAGLRHFATVIRADLGTDVSQTPGAGAAGGLGAGLMAFCNARLQRGVDIVIDAVALRPKLDGADLVITGEGKIDWQTGFGKTPSGVADVARRLDIPVVGVGGTVDIAARDLHDMGFSALVSIINEPIALDRAMEPERAREMLTFTAEQILRLVRM